MQGVGRSLELPSLNRGSSAQLVNLTCMFAEASLKKRYRDTDDLAMGRSTAWVRTWWAAGKARHDDT